MQKERIHMSQLLPGSIVGIIGGDEQVASVAIAARKMGYVVYSYHQSNEAAISMAEYEIVSSYDDRASLLDFAEKVDTLLLMTNLVSVDTLVALSSKTRYYQSLELAEISQNRTVEKLFLEEHAINVAPYGIITHIGELPTLLESIGLPAFLESNQVNSRYEEPIELYDQDIDERVLGKIEEGPSMLTAFVPAQRHFSLTVVRDYEDRVTILPITEDVYISGKLKYSIASLRMNPEWVQELKRIAFKVVDYLSGSVVLSIQVLMGNNGIFYVKSINQLPLIQQQFGSAQLGKGLSDIIARVATGLPVEYKEPTEEMILVPIYESMLEKASLLTLLKPKWDFEFFQTSPKRQTDILGVIRLSGRSSVDLLGEIEVSDLFFNGK